MLPLVAAAAPLLSGCYGKHLLREPVSVHETRNDVRILRQEVERLDAQVDSLQAVLARHDADQRGLKASIEVRLEEIGGEVRSLSVEMHELMNLVARREVPQGAAPGAPPGAPGVAEESLWAAPEPAGAVPGEPEPAQDGSAPPEARRLYDAAYRDVVAGNYQLALMELREFLRRFPRTELADNAQYWIGEVYYAQGRFGQAIEEFLKVVNDYPNADKVPAAYLKTAYCFRAAEEYPTARRYLRFLVDRYPETPEAQLAGKALAEMQ